MHNVIRINQNLIYLFMILLLTGFSQSSAQYQNVLVGSTINAYEPQEPSIVMNPLNTDHILIGSNTDNYYYSIDGGLTWQHSVLSSSFGVIGDPCVLVDSDNNFYYVHLVPDLSRVVCQKVTSLGGSWSNGTYTGVNGTKDDDKEWGVIDRTNNNIYIAWAQFDEHGSISAQDSSEIQLSRSTDGGMDWSVPVRISKRNGNAMGGNYSAHAPMPSVGFNNEVYVAWMGPEGLMFDRSTDQGQSWLADDINVTGYHINWLTFNVPGVPISPGFPIINCDLSAGSYNGNIYICWTDQRSGYNDTDVWLVRSDDGGITWSAPIRVNDDPPGRHQFFAWMTIDQANGDLYFVFYDRRDYTDSQTDVYLAVSKDGGDSFTNVKISESPFIPYENDFLGHYIGISAHNNIVRPVWTRLDNHQLSLWTAIISDVSDVDLNSPGINPADLDIISIYPNPFNPSTKINYKNSRDGNIIIKAYNSIGKQVSTLVDEYQKSGEHTIDWHAEDLSAGVYFIRLLSGNQTKTQKAVLLK
jgi:hypothetical protein